VTFHGDVGVGERSLFDPYFEERAIPNPSDSLITGVVVALFESLQLHFSFSISHFDFVVAWLFSRTATLFFSSIFASIQHTLHHHSFIMLFNPHKLGLHKLLQKIPLGAVFDAPYKRALKKAVNIADLRLIAKSRAHKVRRHRWPSCSSTF
jgi:hypothetical protein